MTRAQKKVRAVFVGIAFLSAVAVNATGTPDYITAAISTTSRTPLERSRDAPLHSADVLAFTRVKPGAAVVDLVPADGYFSRLFSRVVGVNGHVYPLVPLRGWRNLETQRAWEAQLRQQGKTPPVNPLDRVLPIQAIRNYRNVWAIAQSIDWYGGNFGLPQQLDVVFTANAYHDFHNRAQGDWKPEPMDMIAVNKAIFRAMKPGGVYVISDYRAAAGSGFAATAALERSDPEAVKAEVEAAGFVFDGSSEMWANSADDHTLAADDAQLKGTPDRYLLRFIKPASAAATDRRPGPDVIARFDGNTFTLGKPDHFMGALYYHRDGSVQEVIGDGMIEATWYWDADGHNCEYHEAPYSSLGFVTCHPFPDAALHAKPGDTWVEVQGRGDPTDVGLLRGVVYPNARPGGAIPPAAPAPPP